MLARFEANFASLPVEAVDLVYQTTRLTGEPPSNGQVLYEYCRAANLSHADVVIPIARKWGSTANMAIEGLLGHPITRVTHKVTPVISRHRTKRLDGRRIAWMADENPKKPDTRAYRLWGLYQIGMTCDEFVEAGGRRSAIRHDVAHGFIRLG